MGTVTEAEALDGMRLTLAEALSTLGLDL